MTLNNLFFIPLCFSMTNKINNHIAKSLINLLFIHIIRIYAKKEESTVFDLPLTLLLGLCLVLVAGLLARYSVLPASKRWATAHTCCAPSFGMRLTRSEERRVGKEGRS